MVDGFQLTTRIFKIRNIVEGCLKHLNKVPYIYQGSSHLQKTGRLDFSLREHEGEVKTLQRDLQQLHI
jgi:hypothetical protein